MWTGICWLGIKISDGGYQHSGSIKFGELLDWLKNYCVLKKELFGWLVM
jgi:hypothetical protein